MKIKLTNFKLAGYYPYNPLKEESMELGQTLQGCTPLIDANVPGSVYDDLLNAKLIDNPYYNMNSLLVEWVPTRWWVYTTNFDVDNKNFKNVYLNIEGINYKAHIFVNNQLIGMTENMFLPKKFLLSKYKEKNNQLKIVLEHAPDEYGQIGYTSKTKTHKSRFDYKWDFGIRMIDVGIWQPIYLEYKNDIELKDYHIRLGNENKVLLDLDIIAKSIGEHKVLINLFDNDEIVYQTNLKIDSLGLNKYQLEFELKDLKLWYPNNSGPQNLYKLQIKIFDNESLSDEINQTVGFKTINFTKNIGSPKDSLPYTLNVNNKIIYIKGVNMVPLDMKNGSVTYDRYEKIIKQMIDMNVNLVRIWGGGLIMPKMFYDLCDQYGLIVWQDFIQSSSGIDNFPSHEPEFLKLLTETAEYVTKTKRNHVSLGVFCGGNELMYPDWKPVDLLVDNIKLLSDIVLKNSPEIMFYPSTPSGETFAANLEDQTKNHDIHGEWRYLGPIKHYTHYNKVKNLLHGEFGVDGITNYKTIEKTMPENLRIVNDYDENMFWRHRGEWWNTYHREKEIFGEIKDLKTQSLLSQFIQAEGLRYIVDINRRNFPYQSGSIIWQINEPFPNGSCTSLIDYYGNPKLAYNVIKRSFDNVSFSLKYDKLTYEDNEKIKLDLYGISDDVDEIDLFVKIYYDFNLVNELNYEVQLKSNSPIKIDDINLNDFKNMHTIKIELIGQSKKNKKTYLNKIMLLVNNDKKEMINQVLKFTKELEIL